jgi:hypothetical protein
MMVPMTAERLEERGRALYAWQDAGADVDRLIRLDRLDRLVRRARRTDRPQRRSGQPEWRADPSIPGPGRWRRSGWCPDRGREDRTDPRCGDPT